MSHSKGLFQGTCKGSFRNYGRKKQGEQRQVCHVCGRARVVKVRQCFMWCSWKNRGRAKEGKQAQICRRCGMTRTIEVERHCRTCQWHQCKQAEGVHCKRCGREADW